jgi:hypothetical protein
MGPALQDTGLKTLATVRAMVGGTRRPSLFYGLVVPKENRSAVPPLLYHIFYYTRFLDRSAKSSKDERE